MEADLRPDAPIAGVEASEVAEMLGVDVAVGLSQAEAASRLQTHGANRLTASKTESGFEAFVRQYRDFMQIVLLAAAVINLVVTGDVGTSIVLAGLTLFNAVIGLRQEAKAEESVKALAQMMKTIARVRRDGQAVEIDAENLVPGDVVLVEAGNRMPADGRICVAATLEIEEAALTGESLPVGKSIEPVPGDDVPLGDRTCMAYMNTAVTRGRGELIVTATGMDTEIGHIADLLANTETDKTPLQKQLDGLSKIIAVIAGIALVLVVLLGLLRGESFDTLFITGVALAVAAIPTGLPAVVTALLSMGTREIARRNAIVKRLPAVETLGSTSAICSDKTGTLTLNKMTARELAIPGPEPVRGHGRGLRHRRGDQARRRVAHRPRPLPPADDPVRGRRPRRRGPDRRPDRGRLDRARGQGRPGRGRDPPGLPAHRRGAVRLRVQVHGDVPRDDRKQRRAGRAVLREGCPRRPHRPRWQLPVAGRRTRAGDRREPASRPGGERPDGQLRPAGDGGRPARLRPATFRPDGDLLPLVTDLTLLAMVGIVDPPRPEAKAAIAECHSAGIQVRMITGDHATTAAAIAGELGIEGRAITGTQFAAMSDDELLADLSNIGVVARVSPEDKIRLVQLLKRKGNVVSMTGDGVNDAPALKAADIGVAMGITGTEVSKEAAVMILTDDNFATIVNAVSYGRTLYDNLVKYLRFQMSTLVAYIAIFLGAGIFGIAGGVPLNPLQILWLNMVVDIPIAIALGFDQPTKGLMSRPPRPVGAPVLSRANWIRICIQGAVMTVGSLVAYQIGNEDGAVVAATMLLTTLSLYHVVAGLLSRDQVNTIFDRDAIPAAAQLRRYAVSLLAIVAVTTIGILERVVGTGSLSWTAVGDLRRHRRQPARRRRDHQARPAQAIPRHHTQRADPRPGLTTKRGTPCRSTSATAASSRSSTSPPMSSASC